MSTLNERIVNKDMHHLAQSHGLELSVTPATKDDYSFTDVLGTIVTAGWSDSILGDEMTDAPLNKASADDWLHLYCENVLHCTLDDVTWLPFSLVTKEHSAVEYLINDLDDGWVTGAKGGIIFITKEKARQYFKTKRLTNDMVKELEDEFFKQIREIEALKKGTVHRISVDVAQKELSGPVDKIKRSYGSIFEMYEIDGNELAEELLINTFRSIECSENAVSVTFKMDKHLDHYGYLPTYIVGQLKENLLFTPAVSEASIHSDNSFTLSMSLNTIPPFLKLCADTDKDLLTVFCSNVNKLGKMPRIHSAISKNNGYTDWTPIMASALMMALTDNIKDIQLISAKLFSDKSTPESQVAKFLQANAHDEIKNKLVTDIIKRTGGASAFLDKKMQFDDSGRAEGLIGMATIKQKMDFFDVNKDVIIEYGRAAAGKHGFSSFIEVVQEGMSKYGYNIDDISDALNSVPDYKDNTTSRLSIATWIAKWIVGQVHEELSDFLAQ
ncbi:MAG: hypothetical protein J6N72_06815 [Psychrobacter sp.]|nr:hypothetical protein [Psychrobacter sp.]